MRITDRIGAAIASAVGGWNIAGSGQRVLVLSEAQAQSLANDVEGYTRIGGIHERELPGFSQERMQKVSFHLYRSNHMAKRMVEIITDFALGDGMMVVAKHEDPGLKAAIQTVLDRLWKDPINDMQRLNPQRLVELNVWGEIVMPVRVARLTGDIRLGWIDPAEIHEINPDPLTKRPGRIVLTPTAASEVGREYLEIVRFNEKTEKIEGDCFYHGINTVLCGQRGISEFYTSADWFDIYDESMKVSADRNKQLLDYIWDVLLEGATDEECRAYAKAQRRPKPGTVRVHNEKVVWEAKAPQLAAYETSRYLKDLRSHILGGHGYPDHWFGSGEDANLATAAQMSEPTRKALKRKTGEFVSVMRDVCRFQLVSVAARGTELNGVDPMSDCFDVVVPDVGGPDVAKVGSALQTMVAAISQALADRLIGEGTARKLFAAVATLTGVEIDIDAEMKEIDAADDAREGRDAAEAERAAAEMAERLRAAAGDDSEPV